MMNLHAQTQAFIDESHDLVASNKLSNNIFNADWTFLQRCERKLIAVMNHDPEPDGPGEPEYGLVLHWIHEFFPQMASQLERFHIPPTTISQEDYRTWLAVIQSGGGILTAGGTLISATKYAALDVRYASTVLNYLRTRSTIPIFGRKPHDFMDNPANIIIREKADLRIAVFGDWGTGIWEDGELKKNPAQLVSQAITNLRPDIVIHLGDVYYCGTAWEEENHFEALLPTGSLYTFTLNSNHEMYDGAHGYYDVALKNPNLAGQQGTSYFSLSFGNFLLLGLDSAYDDPTPLYRCGAILNTQVEFIRERVREHPGKQIIVMTHHNPISWNGTKLSTRDIDSGLASDLLNALGKWPDYWYYGHLHNGIVYKGPELKESGLLPEADGVPKLRCMGHGGIPIGEAFGLEGSNLIDYSVRTQVSGGGMTLKNRVLNGFALITLTDNDILEQIYEVQNSDAETSVESTVKWTNT
jgi:hypothetical protein